jgi:general secretion pathway protein B
MSLILEALRKSEAERRRAVVPDLLAEAEVVAPVASRAPARWPWVAATGALMLAVSWFAMRDHGPAPLTVVSVPQVSATSSPESATPAPTPAPTRTPALRRPLVVAAPAPAAPAVAKPEATAVDTPPARIEPLPSAAPPHPAPVIDTTDRVDDLVGEERKQLPPLKLSMHMWNDDAAQRFVIIDGTRLRVGDRLGAVVVADILPDGVLLDCNGRALKLPLR